MTRVAPTPLYRQLLPARFDDLPPTVRVLHEREGLHRYRGKVEVERGRGILSRLCAWATRLPVAGRGTIEVEIDCTPHHERWAREFAGRAMRSHLWVGDGLLCERLGLVTFGFRLDVEPLGAGHAVVWRVAKVRALGVPLPQRWFDGVGAREYERDRRYRFDVFASMPWIGRLVHYRGGWMSSELHREHAVIVFDGVCVLCNGWVRFLLRHDRRGRYRFAAMQGESGRALLLSHGLDADDPVSFLLIDNGVAWTDTDAIVRVLAGLGGAWRLVGVLRVVPRGVRNRLYRWFARNRYRIFGRYDQCTIPAPEQAARFLP